jgi:6-phosphogluconolactonase
MLPTRWRQTLTSFDVRRDIIVPGDKESTLTFCAEHFYTIAKESIEDHGFFSVALSGGSTAGDVIRKIIESKESADLDWSLVYLFWSDERAVPPNNKESNYLLAMKSGFATSPVLKENIFRMPAENGQESDVKGYEALIQKKIPSGAFDLMMLGMGDDGHTASLFPKTHGLHAQEALVMMNYVPQKECWRMTMTYKCINQARNIVIYVLGKGKANMIKTVFTSSYEPDLLPVQKIGVPKHKALWILDEDAASSLNSDTLCAKR